MALTWVKEILGDSYTEEIEKKIAAEIPKHFVAKKDFDDKGERLKTLEAQIEERDGQLEELKKAAGSTDELTAKIAELQDANAKGAEERKALEAKHVAELSARDFDAWLDSQLANEKVRDTKSVKAHLDMAALKDSKDRGEDFKKAVAGIRESHDFLFTSDQPIANPVTGAKNEAPAGSSDTAVMRSIMGLPAEKKGD